jgi:hypothetical protein
MGDSPAVAPPALLLGCALDSGVTKVLGFLVEGGSKASAASVRPQSQSISSSVRSGNSFRSSSFQWDEPYSEQKRDSAVAMSLMLDPDRRPSPSHSIAPFVASASAIGREVLSERADKCVATACKLGSALRFCVAASISRDETGGKLVPSKVHCKFFSENGITSLCSCATSI